eukprot:CAMPEP_0171919624 /NCGR_PEP_ID=MMETSP0993-20121228/18328_1 /TAXON_ID=483369 /ORGANISM="non described non described, Strain CCMP2098" /LENGTH=501 /DNA_ID=CAMNT_0012556339 /DNA_START=27 /DNA_END=1532 /DNA_ORIENTATION=-
MSVARMALGRHSSFAYRIHPLFRRYIPQLRISGGIAKPGHGIKVQRGLFTTNNKTTPLSLSGRLDAWFSVKFPRVSRLAKNAFFRAVLRIFRISAVGIGLYSVGKAQGIHDYVRDPEAHDQSFILGALGSMQARSVETSLGREKHQTLKIDFENGGAQSQAMTREYKRLAAIGKRLVAAAHEHVRDVMLMELIEPGTLVTAKVGGKTFENVRVVGPVPAASAKQPSASSASPSSVGRPHQNPLAYRVALPQSKSKVKEKQQKELTVNGEAAVVVSRADLVAPTDLRLKESLKLLEKRWDFYLYESASPNAFVQGMLPCKVFVATGLMAGSLCENDDEVAMVIGHELAHTILDHAGEGMDAAMAALLAQVVLLSLLDPTGVLTLAFELFGFGAVAKYAYLLPSKRCHESEADHLGLTIAAKACYNPDKAIKFFDKLHALEVKFGQDSNAGGRRWTSDHPPTADRSAAMHSASEKANADFAKCKCKKEKSSVAASWTAFVMGK